MNESDLDTLQETTDRLIAVAEERDEWKRKAELCAKALHERFKKTCGHQYDCICADDMARAALREIEA